MNEDRPRLLVLGGPNVDAGAISQSLGDQYDLLFVRPEQAMEALEDTDCQAVLADASDFLPLERGLVAQQSSLLLNAIGEGVCLCDASGRIVWANEPFRAFGAGVRARVGEVCRKAAEAFTARGDGSEASRRPRRYGIAVPAAKRHFEVLVTPVVTARAPAVGAAAGRGPGAGPPGLALSHVAAVVREDTARRKMQQRIDALNRAGQELVHIEPDTVRKLHVAERLKMLEDRVVRLAHDLLSFDHFAVRLLNQETGQLDLVMARGLTAEATRIVLHARQEGSGISGHVAATGRPYICPDVSQDPRYVMGLERAGSSLTVPLRLFDRVVGVFNVESERTHAFTESDRQFAEILAYYLAMALHILNLLLVERCATSETATGTVQGELSEPLNDLVIEAEWLKEQVTANPEFGKRAERIMKDVEAIRRRIRDVARGPRGLLGVDEAVAHKEIDPALQGRRILVADNEPTIRETVRDVLRLRGCTVVDCDSGEAAIKLLDQWRLTHDATEAFDLVISDINLGDKTGYDVFASAKAARADMPVILMTGFGYDPHHSIVRASQEGLQCVLFKPFRVEKLVEEVRGAVGKKG